MWDLVAYAIAKLMDREGMEIDMARVRHLILRVLPERHGVWIVDSSDELHGFLELMGELGLVAIDRGREVLVVEEPDRLRTVAEETRSFAERLSKRGMPLYLKYLAKIDEAVECRTKT